ncbi:LysR family transcriptional regulator [Hydrogenophaga sp. OTU3427]|uniref:LysR family transcriptional regulator n=1 Tax=Hydrogenophaga sp. OTU3427 TaxID=3043856 RepID=UPI00313E0232
MHTPHIDPRSLALFLSVVDGGSLTAGARGVHLSLAAASTRLRELEQQLGVTLLQRSRRGMALTAAGQELLPHARALLQEAERLRHALAPYSRGLRGRIRLAANTAALRDWLPEVLGAFLTDHPDIDLDLRELASADILAALHARELDAGLLSDAVDTSGLETHPLYTDQLVVAGTATQLASLPNPVLLRDCAGWPLIGLPETAALSRFLQRQASQAGLLLHHRARIDSADGLLALAEAGAGLALLPERAVVRTAATRPGIACRPLADAWARRRILLCSPPGDRASTYVRMLLARLAPPGGA